MTLVGYRNQSAGGSSGDVTALQASQAAQDALIAALQTATSPDNATQAELDAAVATLNTSLGGKVDQTVYDAMVAANATDAELATVVAALNSVETELDGIIANTGEVVPVGGRVIPLDDPRPYINNTTGPVTLTGNTVAVITTTDLLTLDVAAQIFPVGEETCYEAFTDAPEGGASFTLDNTTGGPSNAGVTFGTSQIFHAPDRQIFFDTSILPKNVRIKSVSMFEERRGNNGAVISMSYGGVNSSTVNPSLHANGFSATRSTTTFATSQLVDPAVPLILNDPSQNHWDYAQGAGADFIASITPGTATASGGANDGVTTSLSGFNALVEFEYSQGGTYRVRQWSDGVTRAIRDRDGQITDVSGGIPAGWTLCADVAPTSTYLRKSGDAVLDGETVASLAPTFAPLYPAIGFARTAVTQDVLGDGESVTDWVTTANVTFTAPNLVFSGNTDIWTDGATSTSEARSVSTVVTDLTDNNSQIALGLNISPTIASNANNATVPTLGATYALTTTTAGYRAYKDGTQLVATAVVPALADTVELRVEDNLTTADVVWYVNGTEIHRLADELAQTGGDDVADVRARVEALEDADAPTAGSFETTPLNASLALAEATGSGEAFIYEVGSAPTIELTAPNSTVGGMATYLASNHGAGTKLLVNDSAAGEWDVSVVGASSNSSGYNLVAAASTDIVGVSGTTFLYDNTNPASGQVAINGSAYYDEGAYRHVKVDLVISTDPDCIYEIGSNIMPVGGEIVSAHVSGQALGQTGRYAVVGVVPGQTNQFFTNRLDAIDNVDMAISVWLKVSNPAGEGAVVLAGMVAVEDLEVQLYSGTHTSVDTGITLTGAASWDDVYATYEKIKVYMRADVLGRVSSGEFLSEHVALESQMHLYSNGTNFANIERGANTTNTFSVSNTNGDGLFDIVIVGVKAQKKVVMPDALEVGGAARFKASRASTQLIPTGVDTPLTGWAVQQDTASAFAADAFVAPSTSEVYVTAAARLDIPQGTTMGDEAFLIVSVDGVEQLRGAFAMSGTETPNGNDYPYGQATGALSLAQGQSVTVSIRHDIGVDVGVNAAPSITYWHINQLASKTVINTTDTPTNMAPVGTPLSPTSTKEYTLQWNGTEIVNTLSWERENTANGSFECNHLTGALTQWGVSNWVGGGFQSVSFPIVFAAPPTIPFGMKRNGGNDSTSQFVNTFNSSGFTWAAIGPTGFTATNSFDMHWQAIGLKP